VRWPRGLRRRFAKAAEDQRTGRNLHGFGPFSFETLVGVGCRMMGVGPSLGTLLGTLSGVPRSFARGLLRSVDRCQTPSQLTSVTHPTTPLKHAAGVGPSRCSHRDSAWCALRLNLPRRIKRRVPRRLRQPLQAPPMLNETWALDYMKDALYSGQRFRALTIMA